MDIAEDRDRFSVLLDTLQIPSPATYPGLFGSRSKEKEKIGYPVLARPSDVLGGRAMEIVHDTVELETYMKEAVRVSQHHPVPIDSYLRNAIELDIDAVCDGEEVPLAALWNTSSRQIYIPGILRCVIPPQSLSPEIVATVREYTRRIALGLGVVVLVNIHMAVKDNVVYNACKMATVICGHCGGANEASVRFCGHCGAQLAAPSPQPGADGTLDSGGSTASAALICTNCGLQNAPGAKFCGTCGASLQPPGAASSYAPATAYAVPASLNCPSCGQRVAPDTRFCGNCGRAISQAVAGVAAEVVCPRCGLSQAASAQFCGRCGQPMAAAAIPRAIPQPAFPRALPAQARQSVPHKTAGGIPWAVLAAVVGVIMLVLAIVSQLVLTQGAKNCGVSCPHPHPPAPPPLVPSGPPLPAQSVYTSSTYGFRLEYPAEVSPCAK